MVKISRRSDGGKSTKMSFKNVRYGSQKTVSKHLKRPNRPSKFSKNVLADSARGPLTLVSGLAKLSIQLQAVKTADSYHPFVTINM